MALLLHCEPGSYQGCDECGGSLFKCLADDFSIGDPKGFKGW